MNLIRIATFLILTLFVLSCNKPASQISQNQSQSISTDLTDANEEATNQQKGKKFFVINDSTKLSSVTKSSDEWKLQLNEMEYYVIREKGTERAFTGEYWDNKEEGIYVCKACQLPLYDSKTKFKSGTGWPSYFAPIDNTYILEDTDYNLGYARTEIMCGRCEGHLGHVFRDGPEPTGLRHCVNSASIQFVPEGEMEAFISELK